MKMLLLKHIKSVEIGTEKAEEIINSRIGDIIKFFLHTEKFGY